MTPAFNPSPDQALAHLFFHCCFKDGTIMDDEIKAVTEALVSTGLNDELNFKDEVIRYRNYRAEITDEKAYLQTLLKAVQPTQELALYGYCVELCLSDGLLQASEETLLSHLAEILNVEDKEANIITRMMVQRKVVETEKMF